MRFYLSNALGFFLQLAPCAVMVYLPFPESAFRFPRRRILISVTAAVGLLAALFPLVLMSFSGTFVTGDLIMLFAIVLMLAVFIRLVQDALMKKALVSVVVLFYAVSQFWLVNAAWNFLPPALYRDLGPYPPMTTLLYAASAAVTLPVMLLCVVRPLGDFIREMALEEMRREFLVAIVSTTVFFSALIYIYIRGPFPQYSSTTLMELLLLLAQILIYWLLFRESLRRKRDGERQRALEIQRLQYDKIRQEMENTRRLRHDMRHHLTTLGALNAQGKRDEIAEYLKQYGAVYDKLSDLHLSGDPIVNGVLEYYLTRAEERSIPVETDVLLSGAHGVDATDMTVLLGNCLENALEALRQLPEERRRLSIWIRTVRSMTALQIQNTCAETDDSGGPVEWKAFADREGADRRGVGLSSVAAIAEKYSGSALFQRKNGVFTTRVILNPKCE